MPRARFSGVVQSAITAAAVPTLAPAMPAPIRESRINPIATAAISRDGTGSVGTVTAQPYNA